MTGLNNLLYLAQHIHKHKSPNLDYPLTRKCIPPTNLTYDKKLIKIPAATADPITPLILLDIAYCNM